MSVSRFLSQNRAWVAERVGSDPDYFRRHTGRHQPTCLYLGCSDARVPVNAITGTEVGELFVHRNIANQVHATDPNLLAVVQYAVDVLGVPDIVVCGHGECGGVRAALGPETPEHVESWLAQLRTIARLHAEELDGIEDIVERSRRLVELNVREQVYNLSRLSVVRSAWARGQELQIHGWVYDLADGLLRDLHVALGAGERSVRPPSPRAKASGGRVAVG